MSEIVQSGQADLDWFTSRVRIGFKDVEVAIISELHEWRKTTGRSPTSAVMSPQLFSLYIDKLSPQRRYIANPYARWPWWKRWWKKLQGMVKTVEDSLYFYYPGGVVLIRVNFDLAWDELWILGRRPKGIKPQNVGPV